MLADRLGPRYADARLSNFECDSEAQRKAVANATGYLKDLPNQVGNGRNVLLFGPKGTGKDHLMTGMMWGAIHCHASVKWVNGMKLFGEFRSTFGTAGGEQVLVEKYAGAQILAISDPVSSKGDEQTRYQADVFFQIIDERYREKRPTWITINATGRADMEQRIPANIVDRLAEDALAIPCNWESFRQRKSPTA